MRSACIALVGVLLIVGAALAELGWVPATRPIPPSVPPPGGDRQPPARVDWLPGPFEKREEPILRPSAAGLDDKNVYNMAVVKATDGYHMLYRGESSQEAKNQCTGRLFLATSSDGVAFEREKDPVLTGSQDYEKNGVEDPRLIQVEGTYYLTYTGYDGRVAHLCEATSQDLHHWRKLGPIFGVFPAGPQARFSDNWTKSGAILPERLKSGPFAGKYPMIFGDTDLWLATSTDLVHWSYLKEPVMKVRPDHRDCALIEPGPPLSMTSAGILLLYNSADRENHYAMFAALLDAHDPTRVLERTQTPLLEPTLPWELQGYVPNVVFGEALVADGDHWNLYYGGADRCIGLARAPR